MSINANDYAEYDPYADGQAAGWDPEKKEEKLDEEELDEQAKRRRTSIAEGVIKHNRLGWKRLTVGHFYLPFTSLYRIRYCSGCS